MTNLLIAGISLDALGTVLIAYTALTVHARVRKEHHIDKRVEVAMRREWRRGMTGVLLIIIGYLLQVIALLN
ncbi:MAG: hypothetical protein U9M92_03550 [Patescibacteria group bacterium]|nr:hypothetical protein [Patescibacteria group bacterium]